MSFGLAFYLNADPMSLKSLDYVEATYIYERLQEEMKNGNDPRGISSRQR
ncbi:hypothetical protein EVB32_342 [Rhizobium phage RHph_TM39]|uniref:Uncharacterized protein n=2 Tax=Cuauhnahuacvirus TaxID=3044696 RepID=A0A7S5RHF2_9CAUD|nr:hypothetical protein PQC16_gp294 [Rhizobium phage RHph_TM30]YP_010671495.1 hypothetical protein PQC17_gp295 [Rhizobium phage RHph_Y65]QIG72178.1 hypothetical protein EVB95_365 [Rhizobium phage RHph_TM2_3B]QIG72541.1 hypothetical protein EVB96_365 [Rhizobium phage RHph_TM3_3_6]QIG77310.1 hypothetical protein EVB32_342 [Rhizobium phage RHph_TM39]QIG77928.1 hypothetical protein EVB64_362 [Rhizobium phage RHph_TM61]QIG71454.1 hypothetical protein EVB93_367 [Rhizobium phage RHph_TM30]